MESRYGIQPDVRHFTAVVDALSRVGRLEEVESLISENMKGPVQPNRATWMALLGACRWHGDITRADRAAANADAVAETEGEQA